MTPSIVAVLAIGGLLGLRHAFEPDHLAAVSTLATMPGGRRLWSAARLGLIWGLGHTVTVGAVALLVLVLGVQLPARLWPTAELVVAALLILLGGMVIWRYARGRRCPSLARFRYRARIGGERRDCRAARRGGSRCDVPARLLYGVQRGDDCRHARRIAQPVGARANCRRPGCALGDIPACRCSRGERGGRRGTRPAGDRRDVGIMTSGAAAAAIG